MKLILPSFAAFLILHAPAFAGIEADIPEVNRVILPSPGWKPSPEQIQKALVAIQAFLEKPDSATDWNKGQTKNILKHSKEFRVQLIGMTRDDRKIIWFNFFPATAAGERDHFPYWKEGQVLVSDGGFWFWQIEYDPSTGKCMKFKANGDA